MEFSVTEVRGIMNLKELARARGTNLKQVAEKSGVPASTLYAIASGDTKFDNVGISTFARIAEALGMTADELYAGSVSYSYVKMPTDKDELADIYDSMDAEGRRQLMIYARGLAATYPKNSGLSNGIA